MTGWYGYFRPENYLFFGIDSELLFINHPIIPIYIIGTTENNVKWKSNG